MTGILFQLSELLIKKNTLVGVDIGSSSVKLAKLVYRHDRLVLSKLKLHEIDPQMEIWQGRSDAIKLMCSDINQKDTRFNVVINCEQSCTKIFVIPFMPKSEILQALKWEAKKFIPFPIEHAVLDIQILQEFHEDGVKKLKVALACCPEKTVRNYLDMLNSAGVIPSLVTQHSLAMKNMASYVSLDANSTVAFLDIGHSFSEFIIVKNRELVFSRKLPVAGHDFTREMTQALVSDHGKTELTIHEAEEIKKTYGIFGPDDLNIPEKNLSGSQLVALMRPKLEKLETEIGRSFAYYREKGYGTSVDVLFLSGGGSSLKHLQKHLSERLHLNVQLSNPLKGFPSVDSSISEDQSEQAHRFTSALGAALASPGNINLLPIGIRRNTSTLIRRTSIEVLIAVIVSILVLLYFGMKIRIGIYDKRIAAAELQLNALSPQMEKLPERDFLYNKIKKQIYWSDTLKEISNITPEQIRLVDINASGNKLVIKGQVESRTDPPERILTEFIQLLKEGIFKDVDLMSIKGRAGDKYDTFKLRLHI